MPITIQEAYCPNCGGCCVEGCLNEIKCYKECCGCCTEEVVMGPNLNLPAGTIVAQNQTNLCMFEYDPTDDELDVPAGILRYKVVTDENGILQHTHAPLFGSACGPRSTNMYYCGTFRTKDVNGNVAAAFARGSNFGRIILGTPYSNGILQLF